ncbi:hypothetical protein [Acidovorax radicis]
MLFSGSDTNNSSANPISLLWSSALAASSVPTLSEWALMAIAALLRCGRQGNCADGCDKEQLRCPCPDPTQRASSALRGTGVSSAAKGLTAHLAGPSHTQNHSL